MFCVCQDASWNIWKRNCKRFLCFEYTSFTYLLKFGLLSALSNKNNNNNSNNQKAHEKKHITFAFLFQLNVIFLWQMCNQDVCCFSVVEQGPDNHFKRNGSKALLKWKCSEENHRRSETAFNMFLDHYSKPKGLNWCNKREPRTNKPLSLMN